MRSAFFGLVLSVTACLFLLSACFSKGKGSSITYDGGIPDVLAPGVNLPDAGTKRYSVGGTVDGLKGMGLVLQATGSGLGLSASEDIPVSPSGGAPVSFRFQTAVPSGTHYSVVVKTQPSNPTQNCTVSAGTGVVPRADVIGIVVNCSTNSFVVGGTVTGVEGSGLSLNDNGGDTITVTNGNFAFPKTIPSGSPYAVTVVSSPTFPSETCTVTQGSGTVVAANIANVRVNCIPNVFNVGGHVVGLTGSGLVLTDNASDNLTISGNGAFTFAVPVTSGAPYSASIATQPSNPSQLCTIAGQTGTVGDGDVSGILVNCTPNTFTVSFTVTNLAGNGLVLNTSAGSLSIDSNGTFALPVALSNGASYSVAVAALPTNPSQTCNVSGGSGVIAGANVNNIGVNCSTSDLTVSVQVSGLTGGSSIVLSDNGGDDLTVNGNGTFAFATALASGTGYDVAIQPESSGPTCTFPSGNSGVIASSNVTIVVQCATGDFCVNWQTDPSNCGGCGIVCSAPLACQGGSCVCPSGGDAKCGCVDEQTDANNCGACGHRCSAGESCQTGSCVCTTGTMCCGAEACTSGGTCVNEQTDPTNCGACGRVCPSGQICTIVDSVTTNLTSDVQALGSSGCACPAGQNECTVKTDGPTTIYCADWSTDTNNCGGCGIVCPAGHACQDGNCCGAQTLCNGACVDETSDPNNCGGCNVACPNGSCTNSTCCPLANNIVCGNACVDESVDGNCGGCGVSCLGLNCTNTSGPYSCCSGIFGSGGQLEIACSLPTGGGACIDQSTDIHNCGSCGNDCTKDGLTAPACCNGACVDTASDANNCLGCNTVCAGDPSGVGFPVCGANGCTLDCGGAPEFDCNLACTNTNTDPNNCGQCADNPAGVCLANPMDANSVGVCNGGQCGIGCTTNYTLCADTGLCTLTTSDVNNCGTCDNVCAGIVGGVAQCNGGSCGFQCNGALVLCDNDLCADTTGDNANCGGCDSPCLNGPDAPITTCQNGRCQCPVEGQVLCGGACVDETSDPNNCGGCGTVCPNGLSCLNSSCCPGGQTLCNGLCVDVTTEQTDPNNCGGCGIVCPPGVNCQSGTCCGPSQVLCGPNAGSPVSVVGTNPVLGQ